MASYASEARFPYRREAIWGSGAQNCRDHKMADLGIQLGRAGLVRFLEMLTQRAPANRFVASVPDEQTDLLLRDTETDHDLDVYSLLIRRLKCRASSRKEPVEAVGSN
jgi:hypothetical protein